MKYKKDIINFLAPILLAFFLILLIYQYYKEYTLRKKQLNGVHFYTEIINLVENETKEEYQKLLRSIFQKYSSIFDLENYINKNYATQSEWEELISYVFRASNLFYDPHPDANLLQTIIYHLLILNFNLHEWKEFDIINKTIEKNRNFIKDKNVLKAIEEVNSFLVSIEKEYLQEDNTNQKSTQILKEQTLKLLTLLKEHYLEKDVQEIHKTYLFLISLMVFVFILYQWKYKMNLREIIDLKDKSIDQTQELSYLIHNIEQNIHQIIKWNFTAVKSIHSYHYKQKELYDVHFAF